MKTQQQDESRRVHREEQACDSPSIIRLIEIQAEESSRKIAVRCDGNAVTYGDLNDQANRLAGLLRRHDAAREDIVAVFMDRSISMVKSILAIWKCRAAYVLLDPSYSDERIKEIYDIVQPKLILSHSEHEAEERISSHAGSIINIDSARSEFSSLLGDNVNNGYHKNDLCYVFFTSGSTGRPKGALLEHGGVFNHIEAKLSDTGLGNSSIMAQTSTQNFNIFNWQTFGPLSVGATVIIYSDQTIRDPKRLIGKLIDDGINYLQISPSYLNTLFDYMDGRRIDFHDMKMLLLTGEPLKPFTVNRWFERYPHIPILNSYGCTEVSDDSIHKLLYETVDETRHVPIGRPIKNTTVYIVKIDDDGEEMEDDDGNPLLCREGETGKIWLSGAAVVGRGYINNESETKKYFTEDPFTGERLFKIGDLGYRRDDGDIVCLGRNDNQVKINGQRVDIYEIESQLLRNAPEIKNVVILPYKNEYKRTYLTAYFTATRSFEILELRGFHGVLKHLPQHMVPAFYIQLDEFPILKDSGKINKKELTMPDVGGRSYSDANEIIRARVEPPTCDEERFLAKIWSKVLKMNRIGVNESTVGRNECFFNLGGDSLTAALLAQELEKHGYEFILEEFYQASAIKERSRYLRKKEPGCTRLLGKKVFDTSWVDTSLGKDFKSMCFHMFSIDRYLHDLESDGKEVIRMTLGKSDRPLHGSVIRSMKQALDEQHDLLKVESEGNYELRAEISNYYRKRFNVDIPIRNIIVGSQGTSSIYRDLFLILLQDGGEVLLPRPGYILYKASAMMAKDLNGKEVTIRYYDIDLERNAVDIGSFNRNFNPESTRIVVVNSPGNPSGNLISTEEWEAIAAAMNAGKRSILFSDQVYHNIVFNNMDYPSILDAGISSALSIPFVISDSMSKGFEMYTYRVGYAVLPDDLINSLITFQRLFSLTPNVISQLGAIAALRKPESVDSLSQLFEERGRYASRAFRGTPNVRMIEPRGGFYFLLNCKEFMRMKGMESDFELAKNIVDATDPHVGVSPGSDFDAPGFLRVSFSPERFTHGIDLLMKYFGDGN